MLAKAIGAVTYLALAIACLMLVIALLIEMQVYSVPIWPGYVMDLGLDNAKPLRIAMIFLGIAGALFIGLRLRR